jgi:hypothetical protein
MLATILHQEIEEKKPCPVYFMCEAFFPRKYRQPTQTIRFLKIQNSPIDGHQFESKNNSTAL